MKHPHNQEGIHSIDYYAYVSGLRQWNGKFKVLVAFLSLAISIVADNRYVSLLVVLAMSWLTLHKGGMGLRRYLGLFALPAGFLVLGSAAIALGVSRTAVGQYQLDLGWFYLYATDESIGKMVTVLLKALGGVSSMYMMALSTPSGEMIWVLRCCHVPKVVIELMNMIYRFIFILMDVHGRMRASAGSRLGYVDFKTACRTFGSLAGNLLVISLKRASTYYDALVSRGYEGELLFLEEEKKVRPAQVAGLCCYLAALGLAWLATGIWR